jgi:small subunit ribosomal protein S6
LSAGAATSLRQPLLASAVCADTAGLGAEPHGLESTGGKMREYEAMVIVDARLEEGDIQKAVDRFLAAVTDGGGKVTKVDRWGVRRFAYEINHLREGYYVVVTFHAPENLAERLNRLVTISDEYIRSKILQPDRPSAPLERAGAKP